MCIMRNLNNFLKTCFVLTVALALISPALFPQDPDDFDCDGCTLVCVLIGEAREQECLLLSDVGADDCTSVRFGETTLCFFSICAPNGCLRES